MRRFGNAPRGRLPAAAETVVALESLFEFLPSRNDLNAAAIGESPPLALADCVVVLELLLELVDFFAVSESSRDSATADPGAIWLPGVSADDPDLLTKMSLRILATCTALPFLRR